MNNTNENMAFKSVHVTQNQSQSRVLASRQNELRLLKHSLNHIMKMKEFNILKESVKSSNQMMNTVGLAGIASKFDSYSSCSEFLVDIKLLAQSYSIHFAMEPGVKNVVDTLTELCHRNVNSIKTCAECFEHWLNDPSNYFMMVCSRPHLIVYAKVEGFPYWPSKVMSIKGNMANVAFFGDHTQADVPVNKCILYAKRNPIQNARPSEFTSALQELNVHIKEIEKRFGSFCPVDSKLLLDPQVMERQLIAMIPGAFGRCSTSSMSAESHKQRTVSTEVQQGASKPNEAAQNVREISNAGIMPLMATANVTSSQSNQGQSSQKRHDQDTQSMESPEHAPPANKITRSVVGDDVQMHFEALSRRIIELEDEKNRLQQELKVQKSAADASIEIYKRKVRKLEQQRLFITVCAFCGEPAGSPYFCNQRCKMNYDPAEDECRDNNSNDDD
ncbi:zinc finger MYND domain-containing protein 11-like [Sitodiplosis mosellana]|uniref:zinc finger MYND domain-containing protein 11-like n=1 Tax=Sitodiplosis mosellana TaxID=263140 RepID=UPI002444EA6E|nr:zinc finger MYND domain-containing protein 11-like [Sitodiplosis mosellana]